MFLEEEESKERIIFKLLNSKEELRDWMTIYIGITFPSGVVYPTSTHGPIDAMWRIYELMKTGESMDVPQITMLASRDSFKTLCAAAIEVLCMIHFRISVAHMAAISSQSDKAVEYVNSFFRKLSPYLIKKGWKKVSDNKKKVEWITEEGQNIYLKIVIATIAGANSEHVPMLFIDEVDVVQDPRALKEAKMIPSMFRGYYPLTVYLSTRKFAGGLMEKTLKETLEAGGEILRWNIIDVAERITLEEAEADKPKVVRYLSRELPMENLTPKEWNLLHDDKKNNYERFEAYAGIANHQLLPIMRNYLVDRPQSDCGDLYKPVIAVRNNFRQIRDPDWAAAQLLCDKPSSTGLVYSRFDNEFNVLSVDKALEKLLGERPPVASFEYLKQYLLDLGITIMGGGDWGWTDFTSLCVLAILPGGEVWYLTNHTSDEMELDDIVKEAVELNESWRVDRWYVDQNYPAYIKTLKRKGLKVPKFTKVVEDGITAVKSKIVDSMNTRRFYIIDVPENKPVIDAFGEYRWKVDGKGDAIEGKPYHDKDGVADIMDGLRYPFQCLFTKGKKPISVSAGGVQEKKEYENTDLKTLANNINHQKMSQEIRKLAIKDGQTTKVKKKGRIFWA